MELQINVHVFSSNKRAGGPQPVSSSFRTSTSSSAVFDGFIELEVGYLPAYSLISQQR